MSLVNIDVDLLRTLVVVANLKNFTAAGETLYRTQSAISLQIKRLEQMLGEKILERGSGKEIRLTKTGEVIHAYALDILKLNDAMVQEIQLGAQTSVLRIGMPDDYAELLLPKVMKEMASRNEVVEMQIFTDLSTRLARMIDNGQIDIAFMTRHEGVEGFKLLDEKLIWVSAADGRVADEIPLPLALFPEGCGVRRNALMALNAVGKRWHIAYCSTNFTTLKAAILEQQAVGVLPARAISRDMVEVGREHGLPELESSELVVRVNRQASPIVVRLITHVLRAFELELIPK